jgi:small-conductance mechanosensitive channel
MMLRISRRRLMIAEDRILKDPANFIGLSELADSSVNFTVRYGLTR